MSDNVHRECVYLSDTWGIHDQRWCAALESLGYSVTRELHQDLAPNVPIIAGPLTTINPKLIDLPNPVIGLSWGFDLHQLSAQGTTAWLSTLSGLIVDSEPTWNIAREAGLPADRLALIPWGIDLSLFTSMKTTSGGQALRILTLRAHEPLYRVETVVHAVSLLNACGIDSELIIGNGGSLTEELMELARTLKLTNIKFIGRVQEHELPELFDSADVYVSAAETDGTSVTLLQAMCMGVPVVVSDSPGNIAVITDAHGTPQRGTLFRTGNAQSLAQALIQVHHDHDNTEKLAAAARDYVHAEADWSKNIVKLVPLLEPN